MQSLPAAGRRASPEELKKSVDEMDERLAKGNQMLEELSREEKTGFNIKDDSDHKQNNLSGGMNLFGAKPNEIAEKSDNSADNYEDDFDDDIEEDLPVEEDNLAEEMDPNARSGNNLGGSGHGITVS